MWMDYFMGFYIGGKESPVTNQESRQLPMAHLSRWILPLGKRNRDVSALQKGLPRNDPLLKGYSHTVSFKIWEMNTIHSWISDIREMDI